MIDRQIFSPHTELLLQFVYRWFSSFPFFPKTNSDLKLTVQRFSFLFNTVHNVRLNDLDFIMICFDDCLAVRNHLSMMEKSLSQSFPVQVIIWLTWSFIPESAVIFFNVYSSHYSRENDLPFLCSSPFVKEYLHVSTVLLRRWISYVSLFIAFTIACFVSLAFLMTFSKTRKNLRNKLQIRLSNYKCLSHWV